MLETLKTYLQLSKPRVGGLLAYSGLASGLAALRMGFASNSFLGLGSLETLALTMAALTWGILGANAVTCYIDRDIDAVMERTRRRPLPAGKIKPPEKALAYGLTLCLSALILLLMVSFYAGLWFAFGLLDSTLIYNLLSKRKTSWNIILGSPAGGAPAMTVWSAVTGQPFHPIPFLMAALIVLWTPSHIWSLAIRYAEDYERAGVPMLPVKARFETAAKCIASTVLLLPLFSTLLGLAGSFHPAFYVIAAVLNAALIFLALRLLWEPSHGRAWRLFKFTSPYPAVMLTITFLFAG